MATNKYNNRKYINLSDESMENINKFESLNNNTDFGTKLCEITDTFSAMINFSKRELYKYFIKEEIDFLCSAFINKSYTPNINPKTYLQDIVNDNIMFGNSILKSTESENTFISKIERLTSFQCYFLMYLINSYYKNEDSEESLIDTNFNEYFSFLLTEKKEE